MFSKELAQDASTQNDINTIIFFKKAVHGSAEAIS